MRLSRTECCGQELVGAQVCVNRAVFELNRRELSNRVPDDEYTLRCVISALVDLSAAADVLQGQRGKKRR